MPLSKSMGEWHFFNLEVGAVEMEDSGITSYSSNDSVDLCQELEALDLSSNPNDSASAASCESSEAGPAGPAQTHSGGATVEGSSDSSASPSCVPDAEDPDNLELQSYQAPQKQVPIAQLLSKTGYSIIQANGQRRYGPPPGWEGPAPQRGCEVFVGKLPRDCFEDELVPVFEGVGKIYELRLMLDHYSGLNRGYCFVVYCTSTEAKECVRQLNNFEIRKGRTLGICMSVDNCRLFVGGIPKKVTKDDILTEMRKVTEGVMDVIVYPSASDKTKNRGFAFVEYESHRSAAMARRKLMNGRVDLWGHNIAVDWAEPELEVDADIMAQVKVLYVRNLMLSTTEMQIIDTFSAYGVVERVKKIKDYAFVHFQSREDAHKAMEAMNGMMLDGAQVEVTLAKPVDKDTYLRSPKLGRPCSMPAFYVPVDQYGSVLPYYPSYFSPPRYLMRNSMGACAMMQVPRVAPLVQRGGGSSNGAGPGGPGMRAQAPPGPGGMFYHPMHSFSSPAPRYMYSSPVYSSPMRATAVPFYPSSPQAFYEQTVGVAKRSPEQEPVVPGTALVEVPVSSHAAAAAPATLKPTKSCSMLLEEICQKNGWGSPIYSLHSSTSTGTSGEPDTLFLYKATVVGIGMTYIPSRLCRNLVEAREIAAEHALIQLGYPMEATVPAFQGQPRPTGLQYTEATPTICSSSFMAIQNPKPNAWATPVEHGPAVYASPYAESPFPPAATFPHPEFYQPGY